ncbi:hypothetical protein Acr_28g0001660 [Actinidia rufa]|uniref:Uncharacterized protein n=1 Tax=Actinidia rufa TaxID=165716 RepID=A0A7J0H929_9ERIC|nr:hypothetical protein Acr_28g0001660 [Actinidia rufa]
MDLNPAQLLVHDGAALTRFRRDPKIPNNVPGLNELATTVRGLGNLPHMANPSNRALVPRLRKPTSLVQASNREPRQRFILGRVPLDLGQLGVPANLLMPEPRSVPGKLRSKKQAPAVQARFKYFGSKLEAALVEEEGEEEEAEEQKEEAKWEDEVLVGGNLDAAEPVLDFSLEYEAPKMIAVPQISEVQREEVEHSFVGEGEEVESSSDANMPPKLLKDLGENSSRRKNGPPDLLPKWKARSPPQKE